MFVLPNLLPEINKRATRENVKVLLEQYHSLVRLSGEQYEQRLTASYTLEPRGEGGISRPIEDVVTRKVVASQMLENIYHALSRLSAEKREVLWSHYVDKIVGEPKITEKYNVSLQTYYNRLHEAQLAFAEVYHNGQLIVEY